MNRPLVFSQCSGEVFWRDGRSGGGSVYCSPQMVCDLRTMLFQEALDGAQMGDMGLIRTSHKLLQQLNTATAKADEWRAAGRVTA